ncbi:MAG: O-antigen ligase family protein [Bdellovibrionales bacterium]|nr:O-antigen ligase family protein [Oligoflexia bacterium]
MIKGEFDPSTNSSQELMKRVGLILVLLCGLGLTLWSVSSLSRELSFQTVGLFGVLFLMLASSMLPIRWMLVLLFFYLGFEGFFKIISGYHPVVHVGVDLYTGLILLKILITTRSKDRLKKMPPFTGWIMLHFLWFLIAFCNPYALSFVASLAGMKMYVSMVLLFFLGYLYTEKASHVRAYFGPWVAVVAFQAVFSIYQSYLGESSVLSIHPGYRAPLEKFIGYAFRPFGFTAIAGGPAIFIFLVNGFLLYYLLASKKIFTQGFMLVLLTGAWVTLFLCQVRSAILKALVSSALFLFFYIKYYRSGSFARTSSRVRSPFPLRLLPVAALVVIAMAFSFEWVTTSSNSDMVRAMDRSYSAFDYDSISSARKNTLDRLLTLMSKVPLGAGLSRTGAASGKFATSIAEGTYFKEGFFTDNFWLAVLVDLGIPGMFLLTMIVLLILVRGFRTIGNYRDPDLRMLHVTILCCLCSSVAGFYGAESILYNPEAAFFWFFSGVMLKIPELDRATFLQNIRQGEFHEL